MAAVASVQLQTQKDPARMTPDLGSHTTPLGGGSAAKRSASTARPSMMSFLSKSIIAKSSPAATAVTAPTESVEEELTRFKAVPAVDMDVDPLAWMRREGVLFPRIQCVARDVLAVPASSASLERLFSRSGLTCTDLRNCLGTDLVEEMMWLIGNEK